jgi:hypothetical protein
MNEDVILRGLVVFQTSIVVVVLCTWYEVGLLLSGSLAFCEQMIIITVDAGSNESISQSRGSSPVVRKQQSLEIRTS